MHVARNSSRKFETCLPDTTRSLVHRFPFHRSRYTIDRCRVSRYDQWIIRKTGERSDITYSPRDTWTCKRAADPADDANCVEIFQWWGNGRRDTLLRLSRYRWKLRARKEEGIFIVIITLRTFRARFRPNIWYYIRGLSYQIYVYIYIHIMCRSSCENAHTLLSFTATWHNFS